MHGHDNSRTFLDMTAGPQIDELLLDEAEAWHAALESGNADWEGYTRWLEADPLHRSAFDRVALSHRIVDERVGSLLVRIPVEEELIEAPLPVRKRRWPYAALAATVALAVGVSAFWLHPADATYATALGETRALALGSGIRVDLAPASKLIVHGERPEDFELAQGEAFFTVAHNPARSLSIKAGEFVVGDIGTSFGVNLSAQTLRVGVAEGRLTVTPSDAEAISVAAGQQLIALRRGGGMQVVPVAAPDVGSWREGRLVYRDTPVAAVAADISRYLGKTIEVDPVIGDQSFSGVLTIGDRSTLLDHFAQIAGLSHEETGDGARLTAGTAR